MGALDNSSRGIWSITSRGRELLAQGRDAVVTANRTAHSEVFSPGIRSSSKGAVGADGHGFGESLATSVTTPRRGSRHVALGTSAAAWA
jgi:hypothetical protein